MNREVHVRFWERPEVKALRATRHLSNKHPNGFGFNAEDVQRMMRELWVEYVTGNPTLFKTAEPGCAEPGPAEFELVQPPG